MVYFVVHMLKHQQNILEFIMIMWTSSTGFHMCTSCKGGCTAVPCFVYCQWQNIELIVHTIHIQGKKSLIINKTVHRQQGNVRRTFSKDVHSVRKLGQSGEWSVSILERYRSIQTASKVGNSYSSVTVRKEVHIKITRKEIIKLYRHHQVPVVSFHILQFDE